MRGFDLTPLYRSTVGFDRKFSLLPGAFDRQPRHVRLDHQPGLEDLARLFCGRRGNEGPSIGQKIHHLAAGKQEKALPDAHPPDAESLAQGGFRQFGAGWQALVDDGFEDSPDDFFFVKFVVARVQFGGGAGDAHARCPFQICPLTTLQGNARGLQGAHRKP